MPERNSVMEEACLRGCSHEGASRSSSPLRVQSIMAGMGWQQERSMVVVVELWADLPKSQRTRKQKARLEIELGSTP